MRAPSRITALPALLAAALAAPGTAQDQGSVRLPGATLPAAVYEDAAGSLLPVPPALIVDFNERLRASRAAAAHRPAPGELVSDAGIVSLEPGQRPPSVRLAPRIATVVTFSDATGQPWPVAGYVVGDQASFDVRLPPGRDGRQGPSHVTMAPLAEAGWTNLVVELAGHPVPVTLSLHVDPAAPHYRLDVQVLALGPNASPAAETGPQAPRAGSPELVRFIAAVDLPADVVEAELENIDSTRVWLLGDPLGGGEMVVRTRHALLGPDWRETMSGPGGVRVYRLPEVSTLLFSREGAVIIGRVRP